MMLAGNPTLLIRFEDRHVGTKCQLGAKCQQKRIPMVMPGELRFGRSLNPKNLVWAPLTDRGYRVT